MQDNLCFLLLLVTLGIIILVVTFIMIISNSKNKLLRQNIKIQEAETVHNQALLKTIIHSQEEERKRIGQDLHDDVGTALSNLRITIDMLSHNDKDNLPEFSERCKLLIDRVIQDVRHISHNLSPPGIELYGFFGALEELCDTINHTSYLKINFKKDHVVSFEHLCENSTISLYRVIQELINNTIKHARASLVDLEFIDTIDHLTILYSDNGQGIKSIDKFKRGMGMFNIESRLSTIGATYSFKSSESSGFHILITINKK